MPLTERTAQTVRKYLRRRHASRGPLLVSFFGRRLGVTGVYEIMRHRIGMRPHLMRHLCATHLLKNGCGIRVIQELLGHERIDTTVSAQPTGMADFACHLCSGFYRYQFYEV